MTTYSSDLQTPAHPAPVVAVSANRVRGVLDLCVLAVLAARPTHGYEVARALADAGIGDIKGGTLYPLLGRLESQGLVAADWTPSPSGPPRKRYALTTAGAAHLESDGAAWSSFAGHVDRLLASAPGAREHPQDPGGDG